MSEHAVVIAGAGPTGLTLACELALAGVDAAIVEPRTNHELAGARAGGLLPRTLEEFDQRGIADRFVSLGQKHHVVLFPGASLDTTDLPTRHNFWLGLWQSRIERVLADWAAELDVPIYRGCEVTGFTQDDAGVAVELGDGRSLRASYLVGCDGGRSLVRRQAGIAFEGWDPSLSYLIYEGEMAEEPALGVRYGERGIIALGRLEEGRRVRGVVTEPQLKRGFEPALDELREALSGAYGTDLGVHNVTWLSRFTDAARQAASYRVRRVLLAGDAAHVHSPTGGQGLNLGVQDAMNLGWKLAQVVKGVLPETLLDTYEAERRPVGARVLKHTLAVTALSRGDERTSLLRETMAGMMQMDQPRKWYGAMMAGLDIRYELGDGRPMLGRRMPDLDLVGPDGPVRVFTLLHRARPLLLNFGASGAFDVAAWARRVQLIQAKCDGAWVIPAIGEVAPPPGVLVRPDGYVAWAGDHGRKGLADALATWCGPPDAA